MSANRIEHFLSKFGCGMEKTIKEVIELKERKEEIDRQLKESNLLKKMLQQKGLSEEDTKIFLAQLLEFVVRVKDKREMQKEWEEDKDGVSEWHYLKGPLPQDVFERRMYVGIQKKKLETEIDNFIKEVLI